MMKPTYLRFSLFSLLILGVLAGCSGLFDGNSGLDLADMPDVTWLLHSYGPSNDLTPAVPGSQVTLTFNFSEQTAGGNAGCNSYSGSFSIKGSKLSFGPMMSTLMACFPDEIMQQETLYTTLLSQVTSYQIADDYLVLYTTDGQSLWFTALGN